MDPANSTVCIIGAGAAGLTLAHELARRGSHVVVIEGGGLEASSEPEDTFRVEMVGLPHRGVHEARFRAWGGSTARWGGQLWPWESYEFKSRPYVGIEGWPLSYDSVARYYGPALRLLGIPEPLVRSGAPGWLARAPLDPAAFTTKFSFWLPWRRRNLGRSIGGSLLRHPNVSVLLRTTALQLLLARDGSRVVHVRLRSDDGAERIVKADQFVLAAGAVETTRLLLLLARERGCDGSQSWLGRGFMDHLSVRVGRFRPRNARRFAQLFSPFFAGNVQLTPRLVLSQELQEREGLLGAFGHFEWTVPASSGVFAVRKVLRSLQSARRPAISGADIAALGRGALDVLALGKGLVIDRRRYFPADSEIYLRVDTEQKPDRESRISLSKECDSFDIPRVVLNWRVSDLERQTVRRVATLLGAELSRLEIGDLETKLDPFDDSIAWGPARGDSYHMMGGTRMAPCAPLGVVDTNLRVFGTENVYVASTSVFPTGGMANPTLTLVALTLRLADHLLNHPDRSL